MSVGNKPPEIDQAKIEKALQALPDRRLTSWTQFEIDMVKKYFVTKGPTEIGKILGKTKTQIEKRAWSMGLKRRKHGSS